MSAFDSIADHMRELGLWALAHANWHANYISMENPYWGQLSVLQAAHAAEILIKARIAQEHPLLIFEQLPKAPAASAGLLEFHHLTESGRTIQFAELPDRLWATTGIRLPGVEAYREFGRLRNAIQHFTVPRQIEWGGETIRFIYEVIDPFIHACWGLYAIDWNEDYDAYIYLVAGLIRRGIRFNVSPGMMERFKSIEKEWPSNDLGYKADMELRFEAARRQDEK